MEKEELIAKMNGFADARDAKEFDEKTRLIESEMALVAGIETKYGERVRNLLDLANVALTRRLLKPFGDGTNLPKEHDKYYTDGIHHGFGFSTSEATYAISQRGKAVTHIGYEGGGCCGRDTLLSYNGKFTPQSFPLDNYHKKLILAWGERFEKLEGEFMAFLENIVK